MAFTDLTVREQIFAAVTGAIFFCLIIAIVICQTEGDPECISIGTTSLRTSKYTSESADYAVSVYMTLGMGEILSTPSSLSWSRTVVSGTSGDPIWAPGTLASNGVKNLAEEGDTTALLSEAVSRGDSQTVIQGLASRTGSATSTVTFAPGHTRISSVTGIQPSPDWFMGVSDFRLDSNGFWRNTALQYLWAYDAGTDRGTDFLSGNDPESVSKVISKKTGGAHTGTEPIGFIYFRRTS